MFKILSINHSNQRTWRYEDQALIYLVHSDVLCTNDSMIQLHVFGLFSLFLMRLSEEVFW